MSTEITEICGTDRVKGVYVKSLTNPPEYIECDIPVKYFTKARKLLKSDFAVIYNEHISVKIENNNYTFRKSKVFSKDF